MPYLGNADRVEVLKGPAALLYGATVGSIGGIVNVVRVKPLLQPTYTVGGTADTFGLYGGYLDLSQPLNGDHTIATRLIADASRTPLFADHSTQKVVNVSSITQAKLGADTAVTLFYERLENRYQQYGGVPAGILPTVTFSRSDNPYYSADSRQHDESDRVVLSIDHGFGANWVLHATGQWVRGLNNNTNFLTIQQSATRATQIYAINHTVRKTYAGDVSINGKFNVFGLANDIVAGVYYADVPNFSTYMQDNGPFANSTQVSVHLAPHYSLTHTPTISTFNTNDQDFLNIYLNDVLSLTHRLKVSGGLSEVRSHLTYSNSALIRYDKTESATSFRAGPIWEFVDGVSAYASYATTFTPQLFPYTAAGQFVYPDPLEGDQIEGGVKVAIARKATLTAAVYRLTLKNMLIPDADPVRAAQGFREEIGVSRSKGVELDAAYVRFRV